MAVILSRGRCVDMDFLATQAHGLWTWRQCTIHVSSNGGRHADILRLLVWQNQHHFRWWHYDDVIMSAMASQITSLTIVNSSVYSGADQWKLQSSALLAFVWGIHRWLVNSPHKGPVTRKMFTFDDIIMKLSCHLLQDGQVWYYFISMIIPTSSY